MGILILTHKQNDGNSPSYIHFMGKQAIKKQFTSQRKRLSGSSQENMGSRVVSLVPLLSTGKKKKKKKDL